MSFYHIYSPKMAGIIILGSSIDLHIRGIVSFYMVLSLVTRNPSQNQCCFKPSQWFMWGSVPWEQPDDALWFADTLNLTTSVAGDARSSTSTHTHSNTPPRKQTSGNSRHNAQLHPHPNRRDGANRTHQPGPIPAARPKPLYGRLQEGTRPPGADCSRRRQHRRRGRR